MTNVTGKLKKMYVESGRRWSQHFYRAGAAQKIDISASLMLTLTETIHFKLLVRREG
jgi:hypothetical protein